MKRKIADVILIVAVLVGVFITGYEFGKPPEKTAIDYELEEENRLEYYHDGYDDGVYDSYTFINSFLYNDYEDKRFLDEPFLFYDGIGKVLYDNLDDDTAERILEEMLDNYSFEAYPLLDDANFEKNVKALKEKGKLKEEDNNSSISSWYDIALENAKKLDEEQRQKMYEELKNQE